MKFKKFVFSRKQNKMSKKEDYRKNTRKLKDLFRKFQNQELKLRR